MESKEISVGDEDGEEGKIKEDKVILLLFGRSQTLFRHNHDNNFSKSVSMISKIYLGFLLLLIFSFLSDLCL